MSSTATAAGSWAEIKRRKSAAITASRSHSGSVDLLRITPEDISEWRRPSVEMTPYPVRSVPQSTPRIFILFQRPLKRQTGLLVLGHRLDFGVVQFVVTVHVLNVVMIFERVVKLHHGPRLLTFQLYRVLRNHPDLG